MTAAADAVEKNKVDDAVPLSLNTLVALNPRAPSKDVTRNVDNRDGVEAGGGTVGIIVGVEVGRSSLRLGEDEGNLVDSPSGMKRVKSSKRTSFSEEVRDALQDSNSRNSLMKLQRSKSSPLTARQKSEYAEVEVGGYFNRDKRRSTAGGGSGFSTVENSPNGGFVGGSRRTSLRQESGDEGTGFDTDEEAMGLFGAQYAWFPYEFVESADSIPPGTTALPAGTGDEDELGRIALPGSVSRRLSSQGERLSVSVGEQLTALRSSHRTSAGSSAPSGSLSSGGNVTNGPVNINGLCEFLTMPNISSALRTRIATELFTLASLFDELPLEEETATSRYVASKLVSCVPDLFSRIVTNDQETNDLYCLTVVTIHAHCGKHKQTRVLSALESMNSTNKHFFLTTLRGLFSRYNGWDVDASAASDDDVTSKATEGRALAVNKILYFILSCVVNRIFVVLLQDSTLFQQLVQLMCTSQEYCPSVFKYAIRVLECIFTSRKGHGQGRDTATGSESELELLPEYQYLKPIFLFQPVQRLRNFIQDSKIPFETTEKISNCLYSLTKAVARTFRPSYYTHLRASVQLDDILSVCDSSLSNVQIRLTLMHFVYHLFGSLKEMKGEAGKWVVLISNTFEHVTISNDTPCILPLLVLLQSLLQRDDVSDAALYAGTKLFRRLITVLHNDYGGRVGGVQDDKSFPTVDYCCILDKHAVYTATTGILEIFIETGVVTRKDVESSALLRTLTYRVEQLQGELGDLPVAVEDGPMTAYLSILHLLTGEPGNHSRLMQYGIISPLLHLLRGTSTQISSNKDVVNEEWIWNRIKLVLEVLVNLTSTAAVREQVLFLTLDGEANVHRPKLPSLVDTLSAILASRKSIIFPTCIRLLSKLCATSQFDISGALFSTHIVCELLRWLHQSTVLIRAKQRLSLPNDNSDTPGPERVVQDEEHRAFALRYCKDWDIGDDATVLLTDSSVCSEVEAIVAYCSSVNSDLKETIQALSDVNRILWKLVMYDRPEDFVLCTRLCSLFCARQPHYRQFLVRIGIIETIVYLIRRTNISRARGILCGFLEDFLSYPSDRMVFLQENGLLVLLHVIRIDKSPGCLDQVISLIRYLMSQKDVLLWVLKGEQRDDEVGVEGVQGTGGIFENVFTSVANVLYAVLDELLPDEDDEEDEEEGETGSVCGCYSRRRGQRALFSFKELVFLCTDTITKMVETRWAVQSEGKSGGGSSSELAVIRVRRGNGGTDVQQLVKRRGRLRESTIVSGVRSLVKRLASAVCAEDTVCKSCILYLEKIFIGMDSVI